MKKETKYSILQKFDIFLKNKANNPLQVYETFYSSKPYAFIRHQCNEAGLNKGILDIFLTLTTGKSNTKSSLQITNGIVIELYHFIIIKKRTHMENIWQFVIENNKKQK